MLLAIILALPANFAHANQLQELPEAPIVARVGRSALLQAGKQRILLLQGSPYQIGYAHGRLLPEDVKKSVDTVLLVAQAADSQRRGDFFAGSLEDIYKRVEPYIPARYWEELAGLADGAGLDRLCDSPQRPRLHPVKRRLDHHAPFVPPAPSGGWNPARRSQPAGVCGEHQSGGAGNRA